MKDFMDMKSLPKFGGTKVSRSKKGNWFVKPKKGENYEHNEFERARKTKYGPGYKLSLTRRPSRGSGSKYNY